MKLFSLCLVWILLVWNTSREPAGFIERKAKLSEFGFFEGPLNELQPAEGILRYEVNMPLFSNYAEKIRFIRLPQKATAVFDDSTVFELPVGTVLIKNFFFPLDFRKPFGERRILETRLLVRQEAGWEAWPYRWNDEQTDASYDPAGDVSLVSYVDANGKKRTTSYAIPNKNQCKGCHSSGASLQPIGVSARQLNRDVVYDGKTINQLDLWASTNRLKDWGRSSEVITLQQWDDPRGALNTKARSYLDANCGHCHSRKGPANTSGLYLDIFETEALHLGVRKTPVAAGRGSGDLKFDIVPGKPDQSILLFRMKTNDPAIAMPEIGRERVHEEGVALIEEWIRKM
jgi:uncharacterized repeat protein (TIGR03806 family)